MKNKKGQLLTIGAIVIVGLILLFLLVRNVSAGELDSLEPKKPGCDEDPTAVRIKGDALVEDSATLGVKATAKGIRVNEVRNVNTGDFLSQFQLKGFTEQNYKWKVELINTKTSNVETSDKGSNIHLGGSEVQENIFTIDFDIAENNCDGIIDDFDGKLKLTVTTDDNEESHIVKDLSFRQGKFEVR